MINQLWQVVGRKWKRPLLRWQRKLDGQNTLFAFGIARFPAQPFDPLDPTFR
ncbi:hypothetical protein [uncultured Sphingomonas sp.]|uniref:hypothetical protein n=1 Tax=uncultured Sphingomonas sp. TaxID=158754 RepID=UPI0025EB6578|nr:hypothetical protein [uncultured Sphingomonas sp.]